MDGLTEGETLAEGDWDGETDDEMLGLSLGETEALGD